MPSLSGQPLNEPTRRRFCEWLWRRPQRWYLLGVPAGGLLAVIAGIAVAGGGFAALQYSSTEAFCTSCHEMSKPAAELSHRRTLRTRSEFALAARIVTFPPTSSPARSIT